MSEYLDSFPEYETSDMPEIPAGFEDQSWHNDVMPSWTHSGAHLILWIAHSDKLKREDADAPRFQLYALDDDHQMTEDPAILSTDDWAEMAARIALLTGVNNAIRTKLEAAGFVVQRTDDNALRWCKSYSARDWNLTTHLAQQDFGIGENGDERAWQCNVSAAEDQIDELEFSGTLDECVSFSERYVPAYDNAEEIADDIINDLARKVQDKIGQTDGGLAGMFFSDGKERTAIAHMIWEYIRFEAMHVID